MSQRVFVLCCLVSIGTYRFALSCIDNTFHFRLSCIEKYTPFWPTLTNVLFLVSLNQVFNINLFLIDKRTFRSYLKCCSSVKVKNLLQSVQVISSSIHVTNLRRTLCRRNKSNPKTFQICIPGIDTAKDSLWLNLQAKFWKCLSVFSSKAFAHKYI
jgi:hypothetical protein